MSLFITIGDTRITEKFIKQNFYLAIRFTMNLDPHKMEDDEPDEIEEVFDEDDEDEE